MPSRGGSTAVGHSSSTSTHRSSGGNRGGSGTVSNISQRKREGTPELEWWEILIIVVIVCSGIGMIGYAIYNSYKKKKLKNQPIDINNTATTPS